MKKVIIAALVAAFVMSSGMVMAAKVRCKVESVNGDQITLDCRNADELKAGQKVVLKGKARKPYEGC